jgi:hypothetical protein
VVGGDTQRYKTAGDKIDDAGLWIRNRIHLFAANSVGVEEIQQDQFAGFPSAVSGFVEGFQPLNVLCHEKFSFPAGAVMLSASPTLECYEYTSFRRDEN